MDLEHGDDTRFQVVGLGGFGVHDVDGEAPPRDVEDGGVIKVLGELGGVERGGRDEEFQIGAEARNVLEQTK